MPVEAALTYPRPTRPGRYWYRRPGQQWCIANVAELYGQLRVRWGEDLEVGHPLKHYPLEDEWRGPLDPKDYPILSAAREFATSQDRTVEEYEALAPLRELLGVGGAAIMNSTPRVEAAMSVLEPGVEPAGNP